MANNRFRGHSTHTIDSKGRVSIPAKIRAVMTVRGAESLVLVPWERRLRAYPEEEWAKYEDKLFEEGARKGMGDMLWLLSNNAVTSSLDKQGRLLIPPEYREKLGFSREVVIAGHVHWFEFWDPQVYEQVSAEALANFSRYEEQLSGIGLL